MTKQASGLPCPILQGSRAETAVATGGADGHGGQDTWRRKPGRLSHHKVGAGPATACRSRGAHGLWSPLPWGAPQGLRSLGRHLRVPPPVPPPPRQPCSLFHLFMFLGRFLFKRGFESEAKHHGWKQACSEGCCVLRLTATPLRSALTAHLTAGLTAAGRPAGRPVAGSRGLATPGQQVELTPGVPGNPVWPRGQKGPLS